MQEKLKNLRYWLCKAHYNYMIGNTEGLLHQLWQ